VVMAERWKPTYPALAELSEARERWAWLVGRFVLELGDVDYLLADLVGAVLGEQHQTSREAWAGSGEPLKAALQKAAVKEPGVGSLVGEYAELYPQRNYLIHGMYDGCRVHVDGELLHGVTKLDRLRGSAGAGTSFSRMEWTQGELGQLVTRADDLANGALELIERLRRTPGVNG